MAKSIYLGVDGNARKMKKAYIGVGGTAHKIKKIYVSVDGKARLAYTDYVPVTRVSLSWGAIGSESHNFSDDTGSYTITDSWVDIKATVLPDDATDPTVTWTTTNYSSNSGLSTIEFSTDETRCSCHVTVSSMDGLFPRSTEVKATTANGKSAYATITISGDKITGVK